MKLKDAPKILWFSVFRPKTKTFGIAERDLHLGGYGTIRYAEWDRPSGTPDTPSEAEITGLRSFLSDGDTAIDIGAHIGDTTVPMAMACGPSGMAIAIEPNPHVFAVLKRNSELISARGTIIPLQIAATDHDGPQTFWYSDPGFHNGGAFPGMKRWKHGHMYPLVVDGRRLLPHLQSHYPTALKRLRYIKVDTEGADLAVLTTLLPAINATRPYIRTEVFYKSSETARQQLHDFLTGLDYRVFRHVGGEQPIGAPVARDGMPAGRIFDIIAVPG